MKEQHIAFVTIAIAIVSLVGGCSTGGHKAAKPVLDFVWSGGVSDSSASIVAGVKAHQKIKQKQVVDYALFKDQAMTQRVANGTKKTAASPPGIARITFSKLQADTRYYFCVGVNGVLESELNDQDNGEHAYTGTFRTFPAAGQPASFNFIHTCSTKAGSEGDPVFETIKKQKPLFFMHTGDFFYADQGGNSYTNEAGFRNCYAKNLNCFDGVDATSQASLYRSTPIIYMWDDHDFGKNDCVGEVPPGKDSKPLAHAVYREYVPHYPLTGRKENPIYQAFTVGRIRFILTDLRTAAEKPGNDQKSTRLGRKQKRWFKKELRNANGKFPLIVWVTTIPWNGKADPGHDRWQAMLRNAPKSPISSKNIKSKGSARSRATCMPPPLMTAATPIFPMVEAQGSPSFIPARWAPTPPSKPAPTTKVPVQPLGNSGWWKSMMTEKLFALRGAGVMKITRSSKVQRKERAIRHWEPSSNIRLRFLQNDTPLGFNIDDAASSVAHWSWKLHHIRCKQRGVSPNASQ
ncbi:alkaline phosphatase D family protein [Pontiellaceae bacterium B12227]|nr:alkaline phosphatase D family protein [Pontiellaceae bacterium B12227]